MSRASEIIVVDDDTHLREMIEEYLRRFAFAVRGAANGSELDLRLVAARPDLIILDVNMPAEDGFTILRRVRESDPRLGILMLTAAGAVESRIDALRAGADDYLVKPFELRELLARVRSVLGRLPPTAENTPMERPLLPFGPHRLELDGRRLMGADDQEILLTAMEFELVLTFARHPRQIIARDRLAELAHGRHTDSGDRSIDVRITRLRQKIETDPAHPTLIRTIRGEGYVYDPGGA
jgi:DNA-binding response OmpR family regulator